MEYFDIEKAAAIINRINTIAGYVSKERFDLEARSAFGIDDGAAIDTMYGVVNSGFKMFRAITNKTEICKYIKPAIDIAESAFERMDSLGGRDPLPNLREDDYDKDLRRYFYRTDSGEQGKADVNLSNASDISALSALLSREDVEFVGVTYSLGTLERGCGEKITYYEGDIYFLFGDPGDRIMYSYVNEGDAGVYLATDKGWAKLLYTPGVGYVDREGEPYIKDDKRYSDYMIEGSGKGFRHVGNIHRDMSVLLDS